MTKFKQRLEGPSYSGFRFFVLGHVTTGTTTAFRATIFLYKQPNSIKCFFTLFHVS